MTAWRTVVGPVGKTPRHTLTPAQKQQYLEAQRRERRLRRAAEKEERENAAVAAPQKKAPTKTTAAEAKAATPGATVAWQAKNVAPAEATPTGKKAPSRKKAPAETPAMWRTGFAPGSIASRVAEAATPTTPPDTMPSDVAGAMASIVTAIVEEKRQDGAPAARTSNTSSGARPTGSGKRKRVDTELSSAENDTAASGTEDEEDAEDDDCWDGDWDIGPLTDEESDAEREELPASVRSSAAKDSKYITAMRDIGWEYYKSTFGPDPTYANLYDGPYGPTHSVLEVAEDPLALMFYFRPPKLSAQIAVESNIYHRQSIPLRVRAIQTQQRRSGGEVEDLGDIRRRLSGVKDIGASVTGYVIQLNGYSFGFKSKKQERVTDDTCKSELVAASKSVEDKLWTQNVLTEIGLKPMVPELHCDNQSIIKACEHVGNYGGVKRLANMSLKIAELVEAKEMSLNYVPTAQRSANTV
ncbi:Pol protein [Phytophthora cinnamomi]|uniref:Pol protein n=1 Tax=Phytophthora cinnamomi TaxID=4785 RepID=UPI003559693A|nr:Pol protein [Phytophthora cinnamomi]